MNNNTRWRTYNPETTVELAVAFTSLEGGRISHMKLLKLMYLFERYWLLKHKQLLTGNTLFMLPKGPVLSETLDLMNGNIMYPNWNKIFSRVQNNQIKFVSVGERQKYFVRENLQFYDVKSSSVLPPEAHKVVKSVYQVYGRLTQFELSDYTHELPEWSDPKGSARRLSDENLYRIITDSYHQGSDKLFAQLFKDEYIQPDFNIEEMGELVDNEENIVLDSSMSRKERRAAILAFANS